MSTPALVWLTVGLVSLAALLAMVIGLVRHGMLLGRTVGRLRRETQPLLDDLSAQTRRASERSSGLTRTRPSGRR